MRKVFCFFLTCVRDCGENKLCSVTLKSLLTPVGHRLHRQDVGSCRKQALQPQLTLRLQHIKTNPQTLKGGNRKVPVVLSLKSYFMALKITREYIDNLLFYFFQIYHLYYIFGITFRFTGTFIILAVQLLHHQSRCCMSSFVNDSSDLFCIHLLLD